MNKNENDNNPKDITESIKQMGIPNIPDFQNPIQFLTIIGEIEGHSLSPSDKKNN